MAGYLMRWKIRSENGTVRTVTAQSYQGAKAQFIANFRPPKGERLRVWPDEFDAAEHGVPVEIKEMRV